MVSRRTNCSGWLSVRQGDAPDSNGNVVPGTITAPKAGWLILSGTHTFALTIGSQAAVVFDDASVWALFVPFDGEGNKP